jgi:hypothetical protein
MPYTPAAKNLMLNALAGQAVFVSLHTADPGTTGASEVVGGSYARKSITWNAAAAGSLDSSVVPVFDVPAGTTITHVGFSTAVTAGAFLGSALVTSETFASAGTYSLTDADLDLNL